LIDFLDQLEYRHISVVITDAPAPIEPLDHAVTLAAILLYPIGRRDILLAATARPIEIDDFGPSDDGPP